MRRMLERISQGAREGHRSLVVVISEAERQLFMQLSARYFQSLEVITYDENTNARQAARSFRDGEGDVLLGTAAQYGEGVDLPAQIAPLIFFLKPGYPHPDDPQAQFERRKYGRSVWSLWQWRVMISALQVRGRNVRSVDDLGVTFFVDARFAKFVMAASPEWLRPAYRGGLTFAEAMDQTLELLAG